MQPLWNIVQLSIGFLFIFSAFNSQGSIEETVIYSYVDAKYTDGDGGQPQLVSNSTIPDNGHSSGVAAHSMLRMGKHDGYMSLAIIYVVHAITSPFAACVINKLNAKWGMVVGGMPYVLFLLGFLRLNRLYLFASSALWAPAPHTADRHTSVYWVIMSVNTVLAGVFLLALFHFFAMTGSEEKSSQYAIPPHIIKAMYTTFAAINLIGLAILALLKMPLAPESPSGKAPCMSKNLKPTLIADRGLDKTGKATEDGADASTLRVLALTAQLAVERRVCLLYPLSINSGLRLSFWSSIYPTVVASTLQLPVKGRTLLAVNTIVQGLSTVLMSFLLGTLLSGGAFRWRTRCTTSRGDLVTMATLVNLVVLTMVYANFPSEAPLGKTLSTGWVNPPSAILTLLCGMLQGAADACVGMQTFAHMLSYFRGDESERVFTISNTVMSLLTGVAFFYSVAIRLHWHLIILGASAITSCLCFNIAEGLYRPKPSRIRIIGGDTFNSS